MTSEAVVRQLVHRSGLSQAEFARRLGTSPARFSTWATGKVDPGSSTLLHMYRVVREATHQTPTEITPPGVAKQVADALARGDDLWAFKVIVQACDRIFSDADPNAWREGPVGLDRRWMTLFAGCTARAFRARGQVPPSWTNVAPLESSWTPLDEVLRDHTPAADLFDLGILMSERSLATL